jgi:hypothetical protein
LEVADELGVGAFADRGEAGQVGKQDSDLLALAFEPVSSPGFRFQPGRQMTPQSLQRMRRKLGLVPAQSGSADGPPGASPTALLGLQGHELVAQSSHGRIDHLIPDRAPLFLDCRDGGFELCYLIIGSVHGSSSTNVRTPALPSPRPG